ncbi:MAG: carboxypeptidase regulatory-like domain-containing protein, partial [Gemmatimonadota bacterium]
MGNIFVRGSSVWASLVAGLLLVSAGTVAAQEAGMTELRGRVTDPQGYPISDATLSVGASVTVSGADGRYRLDVPDAAGWRVVAEARGYRTTEVRVPAVERAEPLNIVLERAPYELPAVTVTGVTRDDIATVPGATAILGETVLHQRAPLSVMDALRTVPGLHTADEDPYGLNLNVGFRGLPPRRSSRTLLLEDGVPILLGPYGDPSMHYAPPV